MLPYCLMVGLFLTFASSQNLIQNGNFSTCDSSECIIPASLISPWQFSNSSNVSFSNIDGIQGLNLINSPRQNLTQMVSLQIGEIYTLSFLRYDTCLNSPSFNASGYTHVTGDVRKFFSTPYDVWYHEKRDFEAFFVDTIITFGNSWLNNPSCGSIITNVSLVLQPPAKLSTPSKNSGPAVNTNDQGVILGVSGQRKLSSLVIFGIVCGCLAFVIFCFIIFVISVRNIRQRYPNRKPLPRSLRFLSIRRRNTSVQKHAERTLERVALEEQQRF